MLVGCGEPAVNRMKAGSTVQYSEKKNKRFKKESSGSCQVQELNMTPSRLELHTDP